MSFPLLLRIIESEAGPEAAKRIERRARLELAPTKVYIGTRERISETQAEQAIQAAGGDVNRASQHLNVHRSTIYRLIR